MSGALSQTLESVGRNLERGILDAERKLADAREYCRSLETEVRALRAAVRPMAPALMPLLSVAEEPYPDPAPPSMDGPASVGWAEQASGTEIIVALSPVEAPQPPAVAPTPEQAHPNDGGTSTDYLPMLEELWGIARRDASG